LDFISDEDDTPLLSAAYATSSELLRYLIKNGGDVNYENKYGHSALLNAVLGNRRQSVEIATILLDSGVKPFGGMANPYPFKSAVENKNTNMIALFLSRMTNVNFTADEQKEVIEWDKWDADGKIVTLFLSNYFAGSFQQTNTAP
jgi:ankyrin repeat protein